MSDLGTPISESLAERPPSKYGRGRSSMLGHPKGVPNNTGVTAKELLRINKRLRARLAEVGVHPRTEHLPTDTFRRQVRLFRAMGFDQEKIADLLTISVATLRKNYAREISLGEAEHNAVIAEGLLQIATDKSHRDMPKVAMWWLERRVPGFRPIRGNEMTGARGGPIQNQQAGAAPILDSRKMTREQRQQLRALLAEIAVNQEVP